MLDLSSNVFYKAHFEIDSEDSDLDILHYIITKIRYWLNLKFNNKINWNWDQFQRFGDFSCHELNIFAHSTSYIPTEQNIERYWACKISEVQKNIDYAPRTWNTEIGYEQKEDGKAIFSFLIYYHDASGFVGECYPAPESNMPKIIRWLLDDRIIKCKKGSSTLIPDPIELKVGEFPDFLSILVNSEREVPIVFVSPKINDSGYSIYSLNPYELYYKNIMGNALVYYSNDINFLDEMKYLMPTNYICLSGSIRIYMPKVNFNDPTDCYKHRFISYEKINTLGFEKIVTILRRCLSQDIKYYDNKYMFRVEDCNNLYLQSRFISLKERAEASAAKIEEQSQWTDYCNSVLKQKEQELYNIEKERDTLLTQLIELHDSYGNLQDDFYKLESANKYANESRQLLFSEIEALKNSFSFITQLSKYPETPIEIAKYFKIVFGNNLDFTDRGIKSLEYCITKLPILWDCLFNMSTALRDLFTSGCSNLKNEYKRLTGWDYVPGEGKQTRADKSYMALRNDEYKGQKINIEAHIRQGNKDNSTDNIRVYFAYIPEIRKIIVGHCGVHLENYSSQKIN